MYKTICAYKLTNANSRLSPSAQKNHSKFPFPKCRFVILKELVWGVVKGCAMKCPSWLARVSLWDKICFSDYNRGWFLSRSMQRRERNSIASYSSRKIKASSCEKLGGRPVVHPLLFLCSFLSVLSWSFIWKCRRSLRKTNPEVLKWLTVPQPGHQAPKLLLEKQ